MPGREQMIEAVERYFLAMDGNRLDELIDLFAPDAVLLCTTNGMRLEGHADLRRFYARLSAGTHGMLHAPTNVVVDVEGRRAACELSFTSERKASGHYESENCNFFDFDEDGRFSRVRYWAGNPTPWVPLD